MSESELIKVMREEDLSRLKPTDRIIVNGQRAGVLCHDISGVKILLAYRTDKEGIVYEMNVSGVEIVYRNGEVFSEINWRKPVIFEEYDKALLKTRGVID